MEPAVVVDFAADVRDAAVVVESIDEAIDEFVVADGSSVTKPCAL